MDERIFQVKLSDSLCQCLRDYGPNPRFLFYEIPDPLLQRLQEKDFAGAEFVLLDKTERDRWRKTRRLPINGSFDYIFLSEMTCNFESLQVLSEDARKHLRGNGKLLGILPVMDGNSLQKISVLLKQSYEVLKIVDFGSTSYYLFKADKYFLHEHTSWLRSFFSPEVRRQLVWGLRRIENDIDIERNIQDVLRLCKQQQITAEYLCCLMNDTLLDKKKVCRILWERMDF